MPVTEVFNIFDVVLAHPGDKEMDSNATPEFGAKSVRFP
jgi:hypothetical protein